jgi:dihydroneopterin aldolase
MDKVFIKGLHIQTTIGFFQWEKEIKQTLVVDLAPPNAACTEAVAV